MTSIIQNTIFTFKEVPVEGTCLLAEDELRTKSGNTLEFPEVGGEVITDKTVGKYTPKFYETKYKQLVEYLKHWAAAGNFEMSDLDEVLEPIA